MVERLTRCHVDAVAQLHLRCLTGLLCDLGVRAVRAFYEGAVRSERAVGLVDLEQGCLGGFVFGSVNPQQLKREILTHRLPQTLVSTCVGVIHRPSTLVSLWNSLVRPGGHGYDVQAPELTYLAVDEEHRTAGIGKKLVESFGQACRERRIFAYELSVDADNQSAINFYDRLGFSGVGEYREFDTLHRRYRKELR